MTDFIQTLPKILITCITHKDEILGLTQVLISTNRWRQLSSIGRL